MIGPEKMSENPLGITGEPNSTSVEPKVVVVPEGRKSGLLRWLRREPSPQVLVAPGEYQIRQEGNKIIAADSITGKEVEFPVIAGGAPLSSEAENLLKEAKEKEREVGPQYWMSRLLDLHNLPKAERQAREGEYAQVCERLAVFAHDKKLFDNNPEETIIEEQLTDLEKGEIETDARTKEEKEQLQYLLDFLSAQERELIRVKNSLDLKKKDPKLFTKTQWDELVNRETVLIAGIDTLKTEITSKVRPDFLKNREKLINDIADATTQAKTDKDEKTQKQLRELQDKPDQIEIDLEKKLLEERLIAERPPNTPKLSELLTRLHKLEERRKAGTLGFDQIQLAKDRISLSWYFQQARRLGVLNDLEERLDQDYHRFVEMLSPHTEVDMESGRRKFVPGKVFSEVQDKIIENLESLVDRTRSQYVEHRTRWEFHRRRGISQADIEQLQGIREEFIHRARPQMEDSLFNMSQGGVGFRIDRILGEWNVYKLEKKIREEKERQQAQERSATLFRHEHYYTIELSGRNREEIERGADQAADYIIRSATTFSLEVVRQRMELLTAGIERTKGVIESETGSEEEAKKIVLEIQRAATNKLDFFILEWTAANLLMDQFAGYYSDRLRIDGDQKLKVIPAMNDGQVGLAIHWLNSPLYELYHRPQGFKGQLYDDDNTHKYMRGLMKEQIIKKLMEYELKGEDFREKTKNRLKLKDGPSIHEFLQQFDHKGGIPPGVIPEWIIEGYETGKNDPTEFFNDLSLESRLSMLSLLSPEQQAQLFNSVQPGQNNSLRVEIRRLQYEQVLQKLKKKVQDMKKAKIVVTFEDLANDFAEVREARKMLAEEQNGYQAARSKAESAFDTADKVLNIFGETAVLGAPSIVMENGPEVKGSEGQIVKRGDFISIADYVLVQKYAILQAAQNLVTVKDSSGKQYRIDDNLALIRYRAQEWIRRWKKAGLDRSKTSREFVIDIILPDGTKTKKTVKLAAGFEETGLTEEEWREFQDTDRQLKKEGYQTEINRVKFADIIKMDELQSVLNNFLADYKSSMAEFNDPNVIEKAARGRMMSIANIRKRLGFSHRDRLKGTTQQEIDEYTQRIENSRSFDAELERLAYFAATHDLSQPPIMIERGKPVYKFSADRIDYGYQRQSWGVKRLHHLKAFWLTNLRRTVPRAADLVYAMPFSLSSLRRELSFDSFLQMCWEVGKMESIDNPSLVAMGDRHKDMGTIRGRSEGGINDQEWKKVWGFWEKPLVDANSLWKFFGGISAKFDDFIKSIDNKDSYKPALNQWRETVINHLQDTTFSRFVPILVATEKSLGEDRQALSAGSGYEENQKFALRFLEWLMSNKSSDDGREQGGLQVQREIADILKIIVAPNSYREGASIWDEFWRKQTPSHNPRLPNAAPSPTYVS